MQDTNYPRRRYPVEFRERAVRMVFETIERDKQRHGVILTVAGSSASAMSRCVTGSACPRSIAARRPAVTSADQQRIAELEREIFQLRRANEILKAASTFFARELDPRLPRTSAFISA